MLADLTGKEIKSYELAELIGIGGFGSVYRARQAVVDREVAIKIIWPAFANHPNFIRRFETEAQLIASLEHPHIVPLYDYWREPDGAYIVMRWLRGGHLRGALTGDPWSLDEAVRMLGQVTAALTLAHRHGIVHRDIKPENILLDEEGNTYLADFGIAQILSNAGEGDEDFDSMGSPAYAAPEQIAGEATTPQTDLYSLGIILYEMLTGQHPFPELSSLSQTELTKVRISEKLPSLLALRPDLPAALDQVVQKTTALNPRERYTDAQAMARAFRDASGLGRNTPGGHSLIRVTVTESELLPNPYKGLRAFQETDAHNFFGREELIERLANRFKENHPLSRFLAVVGPSGSGKSSVVKAGLLPSIRKGALPNSQDWFFVEMVPGTQPFKELETALTSVAIDVPANLEEILEGSERGLLDVLPLILPDDPKIDLFLFIDQFEEVFTLNDNEEEINRFLNLLQTAVTAPNSRLRLVITLRADFYDRPLLRPQTGALMRERTEVVTPLSAEELERAIVEPSRQVGVFLDNGLVAAIIAELREQPGALPLLQYSLSELFERREGNVITLKAYQKIGGVRGSLARRADELFEMFTPPQRESTRQLFLRLITLGEGTEDTRRRAMLAEVTSLGGADGTINSVVDILGKSRLLTFDRDPETRTPTIEVTHEAIIREWTRLRNWLDESRNDVRMQRTLAALAGEWLNFKREPSYLLRGIRLEQYEVWAKTTNIALTKEEQTYLEASIRERERQIAEEKARQEREEELERRAVTRLRLLVGVLLVAVTVALGLTAFALNQSNNAQSARDEALDAQAVALDARATSDANAALSQSLALEASARTILAEGNGDLAVLLALEASNVNPDSAEAQSTLSEVAFAPGTRRLFLGHTSYVSSVDISPNAQQVVSGAWDTTVRLWDAQTGAEIRQFTGHTGDVNSVDFSPNGALIASGAGDSRVIIWDVNNPDTPIRHILTSHTAPVFTVAFSPDGNTLLTGSRDRALILWDVATGQEIRRFEGHTGAVRTVAFSADGTIALSGAEDRLHILWDVATGQEIRRFEGNSAIQSLAITPDGTQALSGDVEGVVTLWDLSTGTPLQQYQGGGGEVRSIAIHPDGTTFYVGSVNGRIQVWSLATGRETYSLAGHNDPSGQGEQDVLSIAISPDGNYLVSGSRDDSVRLWNITPAGEIARLRAHDARISGLVFNAAGTAFFSSDINGSIYRWEAETLTASPLATVGETVRSEALTPDGTALLLGLQTGIVQRYDSSTGELLQTLDNQQNSPVLALAVSPDGARAAAGAQNGLITVWDLSTGELVRQLEGHTGAVFSLAFTPDSNSLISGSQDQLIKVWNVADGSSRDLRGHTESVYSVAVNPDGQTMVSGGGGGNLLLWNLGSGEVVRTFIGHTDNVWKVTYSPDGARLASASRDGTVVVWRADTGGELQRFATRAETFTVIFSPDGNNIISGEDDGEIQVWATFTMSDLINWTTANRYIRELTCDERDLYRVPPYCAGE